MEQNSHKQNVRLYWPTLLAERKSAEYALQDSEARFRNLIEGSIQGILVNRPDGKPLFVNQAFADALGYTSPQDILAMTSIDALIDHEESQALSDSPGSADARRKHAHAVRI